MEICAATATTAATRSLSGFLIEIKSSSHSLSLTFHSDGHVSHVISSHSLSFALPFAGEKKEKKKYTVWYNWSSRVLCTVLGVVLQNVAIAFYFSIYIFYCFDSSVVELLLGLLSWELVLFCTLRSELSPIGLLSHSLLMKKVLLQLASLVVWWLGSFRRWIFGWILFALAGDLRKGGRGLCLTLTIKCDLWSWNTVCVLFILSLSPLFYWILKRAAVAGAAESPVSLAVFHWFRVIDLSQAVTTTTTTS